MLVTNTRKQVRVVSYLLQAMLLLASIMITSLVSPIWNSAGAAPGDGRMMLFWDGGVAPTGWSCVSCIPGDDFYELFPRGNTTYGGTGGALDHAHTADTSIAATTSSAASITENGTDLSDNTHSHSVSSTQATASNLPSYRQLNIIRANTTGEPSNIPAGAIGVFDASLPSGWTAYSSQNGYFVRGGTSGSTGGNNTHNHALTITVGAGAGITHGIKSGQPVSSANANHTHTASGFSDTISNEPPYLEVVLAQAGTTDPPPDGLIAMWDDEAPQNWTSQSGSSGAFHQRFLKAAATYGATNGAASHTHATSDVVTSGPVGTTSSRSGTATASGAHTHTVSVSNYSNETHLPPYRDAIISKRVPQPTINQSGYRFYENTNSTDVGAPLAALNTLSTAARQGKPFRLRMALHVATANLDAGNKNFKLQYSPRSGTCDTGFSGETYLDVEPTSGAIRYYDNPTPADGSAMTANANDPTHGGDVLIAQSYEELNNVTVASSIASGEDGVWDFALMDVAATPSTSYCFRMVLSSGVLLDDYTVIPEIVTDDGNGHMLLFWDGGSVPSGWSCVSCGPGQDLYQRFPRGSDNYGTTGGSVTHSHSGSGSVAATAGATNNQAGSGVSTQAHNHSFSPTIGDGNNIPPYRQLKIIRATNSGVPSSLPAGAIALFDIAVPTGWTRYASQDGQYIRGENIVGITGGSLTHTNQISGTTSAAVGQSGAATNGGTGPSASNGHTHTMSGASTSASHEPPFIETILGKLNADSTVPLDIITMWDNPFPGSWEDLSGSGQPFHERFIKPRASYGATGGSAIHTHTDTTITSSGPNFTSTHRTAGTNADGAHTHQVTISNFSNENSLPPYIDVFIAKLATPNEAPYSPANVDQARVSDGVPITVGGYANSSQVTFSAEATDPDPSDVLQLCVEVLAVGSSFTGTPTQCGALVSYAGSPVNVTATVSGLANATNFHWQVYVKDGSGAISNWVSFGANQETDTDFTMDSLNPTGSVYDGNSAGVDFEYNDGSLDTLSANWNITDSGSGLDLFEFAIGTTQGDTDIADWTGVGLDTDQTVQSLVLETSNVYFFGVRATDKAGNETIIFSDGQQVAPTLSFSLDSGAGIKIDNVNASNSFTSTEATELTTSTNAYNGYAIRAFATGLLESPEGETIEMFSSGVYGAPAAWGGGVKGYGYTSSDILVDGVNRFNSAACLGGGSGSCYAAFSQSVPGDIVADNDNTVSGTPIEDESFTITQRVSVDSEQPPGLYQTVIVFSASANY